LAPVNNKALHYKKDALLEHPLRCKNIHLKSTELFLNEKEQFFRIPPSSSLKYSPADHIVSARQNR
jgi:hypothetical protein